MAYDKRLVCKECSAEFVFTAGDQAFYASMDYVEPKRCRECRQKRRAAGTRPAIERGMVETKCSECEQTVTVPFRPKQDRPVLCRECFREAQRHGQGRTSVSA